jgi:hypothetical protein
VAGNIDNAALWADADVFVAPLETAVPTDATTEFGVGWELVGLLDGDQGFTESRTEESAEHYAWGGILVRTSRRNFKLTMSFTALEDNDTTRDLIWPGSTATSIVVPRPAKVMVAFELREGPIVKRLITANYAEVTVNGDITHNESSLTSYPLIATIYPDASEDPAVLLTRQDGDTTPTPG